MGLEGDVLTRSRTRRSRRRSAMDQPFSSYLTFGLQGTICLALFLLTYFIVLVVISPLLYEESPEESDLQQGEVLKPVVDPIFQSAKRLPHSPGLIIAEDLVGMVRKQLRTMRKAKGISDESLMDKAAQDVHKIRKNREELEDNLNRGQIVEGAVPPGKRAGFIILGMHRSGTSMLAGLLAQGMGYKTGGPLIGSKFDNEKGFFERIDAVLQNDEFMTMQKVWWSSNVLNYKDDIALEAKNSGRITFKNGVKALAFLNNPENSPWLQKDPRMCITLRTWLKLMNNEPAILFTFRHPLEVAMSLKKREKNFTLERGLRLWIAYNIRALQNSADLCRVYSSNDAILADTLNEVRRISEELSSKCGVPPPPGTLTQEDVDQFVDTKLQHNKKNEDRDGKEILAEINGCSIPDYDSDLRKGTPDFDREHALYLKAMTLYCHLKSGTPYEPGYEWPEL